MSYQFSKLPAGVDGEWPEFALFDPAAASVESRLVSAFLSTLFNSPEMAQHLLLLLGRRGQVKDVAVVRDVTTLAGQPLRSTVDGYIEARGLLKTTKIIIDATGSMFGRGDQYQSDISRLQRHARMVRDAKLDALLLISANVPEPSLLNEVAAGDASGLKICALSWMNTVDLAFDSLKTAAKKDTRQVWALEQYIHLVHALSHPASELGQRVRRGLPAGNDNREERALSADALLPFPSLGEEWPALVHAVQSGGTLDPAIAAQCMKNWYSVVRAVSFLAVPRISQNNVIWNGRLTELAERLRTDKASLVGGGKLTAQITPYGSNEIGPVGVSVDIKNKTLEIKNKTAITRLDGFDQRLIEQQSLRSDLLGADAVQENYLEIKSYNGDHVAELNADRTHPLANVAASYGRDRSYFLGTRTDISGCMSDADTFARFLAASVLDRFEVGASVRDELLAEADGDQLAPWVQEALDSQSRVA